MTSSIDLYEMAFTQLNGQILKLSQFRDHVLLIVNTASYCGFTSQYQQLEDLWRTYRDRGFTIIGCPCNQFGRQEPGSNQDVQAFCELRYQVSFPLSAKINVNGSRTHQVFKLLKELAPGFLGTSQIKWNFTKFLITPNAGSVTRFSPHKEPRKLVGAIEGALTSQDSASLTLPLNEVK